MDRTRRQFIATALAAPVAAAAAAAAARNDTGAAVRDAAASRERFDFIIAGAGHNSLMTACYLQKAGFKVMVLEGRPTVGGGVKTANLTLAGFHHDVCSSIHGIVQFNPAIRDNELQLDKYGLEYINPDPSYHYAFPDGTYLTRWRDLDRTCDEEIARYSKKDADTYRRMARELAGFYQQIGNPLEVLFKPIGWGDTFEQKLARHPQANLWKTRLALSKWDTLQKYFEEPRVIATMLSPWPTSSASNPSTAPGQGLEAWPALARGSAMPKGGSGMLSVALQRCFEAHGGVVLCNQPVVRLVVEGGRCTGVECADGSIRRADRGVVSTLHIKRLVEMAPRELWPADFIEGVESLQTGDAAFNVHYATTAPCLFPVKGGMLAPVHIGNLSSPRRALRFEAELAAREFTWDEPVLHIVQTSVADSTRVPQQGWQTLRILCEQAVYDPVNIGTPRMTPREKWESIRDEVATAHLRTLQKLAPNLTDDRILARTIITPPETEQMNAAMYHGSCHGYTDNPYQYGENRPAPGWADYRMPIPGLYQTGTTTHGGGGVSGASGRNTAAVLIREFSGRSIEEAVSRS